MTVGGLVLGVALFWWGLPWFFPIPEALREPLMKGLVVLDRNDELIARIPDKEHKLSLPVGMEAMPCELVQAILAAEDKRFFEHDAVDFIATCRAAGSQLGIGKGIPSGASTISQQLVKISRPKSRRSIPVKLREILTARRLEMSKDKTWILREYLNRTDFGSMAFGVEAASIKYFGKSVSQLSLAQCALLAGLPQAPGRYNPILHPDVARARRNYILTRMQAEGMITEERATRAKNEEVGLVRTLQGNPEIPSSIASHFVSRLLRSDKTGIISTTLDAGIQRRAQAIAIEEMGHLRNKDAGQAAILVANHATGEILAWVGSTNRLDPKGGLLDGVVTPRSPGSTLKPFVYGMAFDNGAAWPGQIIPDVPSEFRDAKGTSAPKNYNDRYSGPVSVRNALACSLNIPAMRILNLAGGTGALVNVLRQAGFTTINRPAREYGLGLSIGNANVSLLELVQAYALLARGGMPVTLYWDRLNPPVRTSGKHVFSLVTCKALADILSDSQARVEAFGIGGPLDLPFRTAVKTGTSSDFRDNWCIGFTGQFTVGVWVGNFDFRRMKAISGVSGAGPIFHRVMVACANGSNPGFPETKQGLVRVRVDKRNGLLWPSTPLLSPDWAQDEWTFPNRIPAQAGPENYDDQGNAILGSEYADWFRNAEDSDKAGLVLNASLPSSMERPKITVPPPGSVLVLDPDLPDGGRFLHLKSNLPVDTTVWESDTLTVTFRHGRPVAELIPGKHTIRATHQPSGTTCKTSFTVRQL